MAEMEWLAEHRWLGECLIEFDCVENRRQNSIALVNKV